MWFVALLFLFSATASCAPGLRSPAAHSSPTPGSSSSGPYSHRTMVSGLACLVAGLTGLAVPPRLLMPTDTFVAAGLNIPMPYLGEYIVAFWLGIRAGRTPGALERVPPGFGRGCLLVAAAWLGAGTGLAWALAGRDWIPVLSAGGYTWQGGRPGAGFQLFFALFEQSFAVLWSLGLLALFRARCNRPAGGVGAVVVGAAYGAYIVHPLFLVLSDRALHGSQLPAGAKAALATPLVLALSWAAAALARAVPGAAGVL